MTAPRTALLALLSGGSAFAIAAGWRLQTQGRDFLLALPDDLMEFDAVVASVSIATLFMIGTPVLVVIAVVAGIGSRNFRAAKWGLALASAAAAIYAMSLKTWMSTLIRAGG